MLVFVVLIYVYSFVLVNAYKIRIKKRVYEFMEIVKKKCCKKCLYSKRKIVSDEAKKDILSKCRKSKSNFICHESTIIGEEHICRGFYEKENDPNLSKLMERIGLVVLVD